jgi:hypothetical protein
VRQAATWFWPGQEVEPLVPVNRGCKALRYSNWLIEATGWLVMILIQLITLMEAVPRFGLCLMAKNKPKQPT